MGDVRYPFEVSWCGGQGSSRLNVGYLSAVVCPERKDLLEDIVWIGLWIEIFILRLSSVDELVALFFAGEN